MDLVGDPLQGTCRARASEILITKVHKISTYDFVGSLRSTWLLDSGKCEDCLQRS